MKKIIIAIFLLFEVTIYAQSHPMVRYNVNSQLLDTIPSFEIDSISISENTIWNYGSSSDREYLNLFLQDSTYKNAGFTDYHPAQNYFDVNKFPIRTAVKLFRIENDSLKQKCSGNLVSPNYVLTDCHCIGKYDSLMNFVFEDSLYVFPAFDNGMENQFWSNSKALEYISFTANMKQRIAPLIDIALIKLEDSLGINTGWIGMGFNDDDKFFENNIFHKFSYPSTFDLSDSTRYYNGDTLYYNYGNLDIIQRKSLGYRITGIKGQSGSSLFYTDNYEYLTFGTQVNAWNSSHIRIDRQIFYSFKSIIDDQITSVNKFNKIENSFYLSDAFPNPFNPSTNIIYSVPSKTNVSIDIYNLLGEHVSNLVNDYMSKGTYTVKVDGSNLSSGIYFYVMVAEGFLDSKKILLIK